MAILKAMATRAISTISMESASIRSCRRRNCPRTRCCPPDRTPLPGDRRGRRHHHRPPELVERAAGDPARVVRPRAARRTGLQLRADGSGGAKPVGLLKAKVGSCSPPPTRLTTRKCSCFGTRSTHTGQVVFGPVGVARPRNGFLADRHQHADQRRECCARSKLAGPATPRD